MSMEITGITGHAAPAPRATTERTASDRVALLGEQRAGRSAAIRDTQPETPVAPVMRKLDRAEIDLVLKEIESVATAMNHRLKFSVNRELNEVVVKVIDRATDKVIKELPPEEIQRLHVRIREAIGLLIDEEI